MRRHEWVGERREFWLQSRPQIRYVDCPDCGSVAGQPCVRGGSFYFPSHRARLDVFAMKRRKLHESRRQWVHPVTPAELLDLSCGQMLQLSGVCEAVAR